MTPEEKLNKLIKASKSLIERITDYCTYYDRRSNVLCGDAFKELKRVIEEVEK